MLVHTASARALSKGRPPKLGLWAPYALGYVLLCCAGAGYVWNFNPSILVTMPAGVLLLAALSVAVAFACGGQAYIHSRFSTHDFVQHNEVGGFIIAVAGTLYAVLLGFLTAVAWQNFAEARQLVTLEAAAATDVWHTAVGMPQSERSRVRHDALEYSLSMLETEWPQMRSGRRDAQADYILMDAMTASGAFRPADLMQSNAQSQTIAQLTVVHDVRQRRLTENTSSISPFEWLVLVLGAACIVAFCWLFGLANGRIHLLMTATVAILTASVLVLLFELQFPFRSDLRIMPDSWEASVSHIRMMQAGPQSSMRM